MMTGSPSWWLRFGLLLPEAGGSADSSALDGKATDSLYKRFVETAWDWSAYAQHFDYLCEQLGPPRCYRTRMPVQAGAGDAHVLEGPALSLHPVFGAPVIDGPTIKGLCHAARLRLPVGDGADALSDADRADAMATSYGTPRRRGTATFETALWVPPGATRATSAGGNPFVREIDNAHTSGQPVPVWRLAAQGNFAFWLADAASPSDDWTDLAWADLEFALAHMGVGARRNIDAYGRMARVHGGTTTGAEA